MAIDPSLPNRLTLARIVVAIPAMLLFLLAPGAIAYDGFIARSFGFAQSEANPLTAALFRTAAFAIAVAAAVSDWLDGHLARKHGLQSNFGKLMDPLADKLFVTAAFVAFVELGIFPSWLVIIILCREFLVSGLRSLAAASGQVMAADRLGKHKTGWQLATILTTIGFLAIRDYLRAAGVWDDPLVTRFAADRIYDIILHVLLLVALFLTVASGGRYLMQNLHIIRESTLGGGADTTKRGNQE
ncbi:MAG: CDP-diacylglycerol--glycerol-3-phosphate 3-phosphatidyltransferase [Candidatus Sumerlaeia bacterium]|nr:CDP-diacylglycerol--glycerol-3-phosphate 3-phosphatidyltransferase [Candidatus Sumerlaeia bacterium]